MAYDEQLAARIRTTLGDEPDLTEQRMFGGLGFMLAGHMVVAASGQGGLLVRVDPDDSDRLVDTTNARPMQMRGRAMRGWLLVDDADVRTSRQLTTWVKRATRFVRTLPPKR